jgi:hypothetical protein
LKEISSNFPQYFAQIAAIPRPILVELMPNFISLLCELILNLEKHKLNEITIFGEFLDIISYLSVDQRSEFFPKYFPLVAIGFNCVMRKNLLEYLMECFPEKENFSEISPIFDQLLRLQFDHNQSTVIVLLEEFFRLKNLGKLPHWKESVSPPGDSLEVTFHSLDDEILSIVQMDTSPKIVDRLFYFYINVDQHPSLHARFLSYYFVHEDNPEILFEKFSKISFWSREIPLESGIYVNLKKYIMMIAWNAKFHRKLYNLFRVIHEKEILLRELERDLHSSDLIHDSFFNYAYFLIKFYVAMLKIEQLVSLISVCSQRMQQWAAHSNLQQFFFIFISMVAEVIHQPEFSKEKFLTHVMGKLRDQEKYSDQFAEAKSEIKKIRKILGKK